MGMVPHHARVVEAEIASSSSLRLQRLAFGEPFFCGSATSDKSPTLFSLPIMATFHRHDLTVLTYNMRHFKRIPRFEAFYSFCLEQV